MARVCASLLPTGSCAWIVSTICQPIRYSGWRLDRGSWKISAIPRAAHVRAAARSTSPAGRDPRNRRLAGDPCALGQAHHRLRGDALAGARLADDAEHLAAGDVEREAADRLDDPVGRREGHGQVPDVEQRHAATPSAAEASPSTPRPRRAAGAGDGQHAAAVLGDEDVVLDADADAAVVLRHGQVVGLEVQPGLDGEDHARLQGCRRRTSPRGRRRSRGRRCRACARCRAASSGAAEPEFVAQGSTGLPEEPPLDQPLGEHARAARGSRGSRRPARTAASRPPGPRITSVVDLPLHPA